MKTNPSKGGVSIQRLLVSINQRKKQTNTNISGPSTWKYSIISRSLLWIEELSESSWESCFCGLFLSIKKQTQATLKEATVNPWLQAEHSIQPTLLIKESIKQNLGLASYLSLNILARSTENSRTSAYRPNSMTFSLQFHLHEINRKACSLIKGICAHGNTVK